jgi:hypothetical protein
LFFSKPAQKQRFANNFIIFFKICKVKIAKRKSQIFLILSVNSYLFKQALTRTGTVFFGLKTFGSKKSESQKNPNINTPKFQLVK